MAERRGHSVRTPATKLPHLQKQMRKGKLPSTQRQSGLKKRDRGSSTR